MDALQPGDPGSVGGYRLLGRLGAGGMGQVYLGVSPSGRRVAVKLIHPVHSGTAHFRERFAREIDAARRVGGFHTAVVVDADPQADPPWMITAYIDGPSLQAEVDRSGPLPPEGVRALGAGLAEGLAAIHACGLVHRDLKPGNVILAADGPRIIDFGIARAADATTGLTSTGVVVGTFAYMSPEQLRGEAARPASDVFALGCVLAFAATGRPPFGREPAATVMFRIVAEPPDLAGLADKGLRQLIEACLAKTPRSRPAVQALLAGLSGMAPVSAARTAVAGVQAAEGTPTQAQAPVSAQTGPGHAAPLRSGTAPPAKPLQAAPPRIGPPRVRPPAAPVPSAHLSPVGARRKPRSWRRPTVFGPAAVIAAALAVAIPLVLATSTPQAAANHRPTAPASASSPIPEKDLFLRGSNHFSRFGNVVFSPDGRVLAADGGGRTYLWDVSTGTVTATLTDAESGVGHVAFSPNGTLLADGGDAGNRVYLRDAATGAITATLTDPGGGGAALAYDGGVQWLAFSPNGTLLAVADNMNVYVWDVATRALVHNYATNSLITEVTFSPDGTLLAAGAIGGSAAAFVWDVATGKRVHNLVDHGGRQGAFAVAFSPNGKVLAIGDYSNGKIYLWDTSTDSIVATLPSLGSGFFDNGLAFSPNGTILASGDTNGCAYLWDLATGKVMGKFNKFNSTAGPLRGQLAFSPDGNLLAMTTLFGAIYVRLTSKLVS